jgi:hypothetical protein
LESSSFTVNAAHEKHKVLYRVKRCDIRSFKTYLKKEYRNKNDTTGGRN